jgi:AcrR family transcriptional regulator
MKKSDTKRKIIQKATDLFFKRGFVKASIRDIVRAVGVSKSTVYIYFKNKDEILFSIVDDIYQKLIELQNKTIEEHDDPLECLRELIRNQILLINKRRKEFKVYIEEQYQLSPALREKARDQQRRVFKIMYNKICEAEDEGLLRRIDKHVTVFSIFGMVNWTYRWVVDGGPLSIEEIVDQIVDLLYSGLVRGNAS